MTVLKSSDWFLERLSLICFCFYDCGDGDDGDDVGEEVDGDDDDDDGGGRWWLDDQRWKCNSIKQGL